MPKQDEFKLYLFRFRLPDGEHISAMYAVSDKRAERDARRQMENRNTRIPDEPAEFISVKRSTQAEIDAEKAKLQQADPDRLLADDLHPGEPNRILHERVTPQRDDDAGDDGDDK